jgi:hypothetical protein
MEQRTRSLRTFAPAPEVPTQVMNPHLANQGSVDFNTGSLTKLVRFPSRDQFLKLQPFFVPWGESSRKTSQEDLTTPEPGTGKNATLRYVTLGTKAIDAWPFSLGVRLRW